MNKKQILRRIMQIVIVLIGISFVTFLLTYLSPGDPVRNMFSATGVMPTEELVQQTRDEMGLNDPFFTQYFRWLFNCLHGDFGTSYSLNKPVTELLSVRLWKILQSEQAGCRASGSPCPSDSETDTHVIGADADHGSAAWRCISIT